MGAKQSCAIEWEELLQLLRRFCASGKVREISIKNNQTAILMGRTPINHVDLDIFVYYFGEAPSSEVQRGIVQDFIGNNGARKIWDGLNIAALWNDLSVRLYNCLLFWPPERNQINQNAEFEKIGFILNNEGGAEAGINNKYTWECTDEHTKS